MKGNTAFQGGWKNCEKKLWKNCPWSIVVMPDELLLYISLYIAVNTRGTWASRQSTRKNIFCCPFKLNRINGRGDNFPLFFFLNQTPPDFCLELHNNRKFWARSCSILFGGKYNSISLVQISLCPWNQTLTRPEWKKFHSLYERLASLGTMRGP